LHHRGEQQTVETIAIGRLEDQRAVRQCLEQSPLGRRGEELEALALREIEAVQTTMTEEIEAAIVSGRPAAELGEHGEGRSARRRRWQRRRRAGGRGGPERDEQQHAGDDAGEEASTLLH